MYVIVFDKPGKGLSGWHYKKLRELDSEWIQQSVIKLNDIRIAVEFAKKLHEFGVRDIKIFRAFDVTSKLEDYEGS